MTTQAKDLSHMCSDCHYALLDAGMTRQEKRMVFKNCKTPGCPSWNKKNAKRNRPSVLEAKRYA